MFIKFSFKDKILKIYEGILEVMALKTISGKGFDRAFNAILRNV